MTLKDTLTYILYTCNNDVIESENEIRFSTYINTNPEGIIHSMDVALQENGLSYANIFVKKNNEQIFDVLKIGNEFYQFNVMPETSQIIKSEGSEYILFNMNFWALDKLFEGVNFSFSVNGESKTLIPEEIMGFAVLTEILALLNMFKKNNPKNLFNLWRGRVFYNYYFQTKPSLANKGYYFIVSNDKPFSYIYNLEDMDNAVNRSKSELDYFLNELAIETMKNESNTLYRVYAIDEDNHIKGWFTNVFYDKEDRKIKGMASENEIFVIDENKIVDWVITPKNGYSKGGYTVKVLRQELDLKTLAYDAILSHMYFESEKNEGKYVHVDKIRKSIFN